MIELSRAFVEEIGLTVIFGVCALLIFFVKRMFVGIEKKLDRLEAQTMKLQSAVDELQSTALNKEDFQKHCFELFQQHLLFCRI